MGCLSLELVGSDCEVGGRHRGIDCILSGGKVGSSGALVKERQRFIS